MSTTIIAPIVGFIFFILQSVFHITVDVGVQSQAVDAIGWIVSGGLILYGIFKNHFKTKNP